MGVLDCLIVYSWLFFLSWVTQIPVDLWFKSLMPIHIIMVKLCWEKIKNIPPPFTDRYAKNTLLIRNFLILLNMVLILF